MHRPAHMRVPYKVWVARPSAVPEVPRVSFLGIRVDFYYRLRRILLPKLGALQFSQGFGKTRPTNEWKLRRMPRNTTCSISIPLGGVVESMLAGALTCAILELNVTRWIST